MKRRSFILLLLVCAAAFAAALWGSLSCGAKLEQVNLNPAQEQHLRGLIFFHFAVSQLAILGVVALFYLRHRRWKRYYLLVSYNEKGLQLDPPGIRMPRARVYRCHLGNLSATTLPPTDAPILVYPMFMLSGSSSGHRLSAALQSAYAAQGKKPQLYYQPVLGASPWLAEAAAEAIRPLLKEETGVLVVAHGSPLPEPPPEPYLFCRRLRELLPGTEVACGYFRQQPEAVDVLRCMSSRHILLLPFLLTEGLHTARDLPTPQEAATCGKTLCRLPVAASLLTSHSQIPQP